MLGLLLDRIGADLDSIRQIVIEACLNANLNPQIAIRRIGGSSAD